MQPQHSYYQSNPFSRWWRSGLSSMVRAMLPKGWEGMRFLDVGVGDGYTIRLVKAEGEVFGIDFDKSSVAQALGRDIMAVESSTFKIPFAEASFDMVACLEVLEHLDKPSESLREIERVTKPGGYLVISTPITNARWRLIWWLWTKVGPGKRWEKIPHITELHVGDEPEDDGGLRSMLRGLGFEIVTVDKCNFGMVAGLLARKRLGPN